MKVVIVSPVTHDGEVLEIGDTPDLPKDVAAALVACGAALEAPAGKKADKPAAE